MVFLHGTTIMHRTGVGRTREERVQQVREGDVSLHNYAAYIPVSAAVSKLWAWKDQGAEIVYLSSHTTGGGVAQDRFVLSAYGFPNGPVYFCHRGEAYQDVVERVMPDVLIEDDCESIGGEVEMTYPHIRSELKEQIKSIVVKEFGGIDHLPNKVSDLVGY
jgi:hypothetical protein